MKRLSCPLIVALLFVAGCESAELVRKYDGPLVEQSYLFGDRFVSVDGIKICYTTAGSGPPLIFMRGVGGAVDYWDETLPYFVNDYTVYALDLPGFGKSDKPDVDYSLDFHTKMVFGFMDALGIRRTSIVGNSLGGHIGLKIAIDHPERIDRLVLQSCTGVWEKPSPTLAWGLETFFTDKFFYNWSIRSWYATWVDLTLYATPNSEQKLTSYIRMRHRRDYPEWCRAYARTIRQIFYNSLRDEVRNVKCPTLILWGDDDRLHPIADATFLYEHIPHSTLRIFKDGRHMLVWDFKDDFNREVMTFLKSAGPLARESTVIVQRNHDLEHYARY